MKMTENGKNWGLALGSERLEVYLSLDWHERGDRGDHSSALWRHESIDSALMVM